MDGTFRTQRFTVDRAAYLRTMYTFRLGKRLLIGIALILAASGLLALLGQPSMSLGVVIGLAIFVPLALVARYFNARRNVYRPSARQVFDDPRVMDFSDAGVHTRTDGGLESTVPWTHIVEVAPRGGFTLLFTGPIVHLIVADSAFASPADRDAFLALARRQVTKAPLTR